MDFFDEDDPAENDEPERSSRERRRPRERGTPQAADRTAPQSRQQARTRQLTLAGVSIVVLILLFLAFRGCLDARKDRAFKNYVSDLTALTTETDQLSEKFFGALDGSNEGDIGLESEVNGDRGTAQGLLDRAQGLDAPDDIAGAQADVVRAYQLRRDGLDVIAAQLPAALGNQGSNKAIKVITEQMQAFLASDVLYSQARSAIQEGLDDREIVVDGGVPTSEFLPLGKNDPDYLNQDEVASLISGAAGGSSVPTGGDSADCDPGDTLTHGLGLVSTTAQPSGTVLQPGTTASVPAQGTEFAVDVMNQGEADESQVKVTLSGDLSGNQTIDSIAAAETQTVTIVPKPAPTAGETASVTVTVDTVCGEQVAENNVSEPPYEIAFE